MPFIVAVVAPVFHRYVYGAIPPASTTVTAPLQTPQSASVTFGVKVIGPGSLTVARESLTPPPLKEMFQSKIKPLSMAKLSVIVIVQSPFSGQPIKPDSGSILV